MICVVGNPPFICQIITQMLSEKWEVNRFFIWKACELYLQNNSPELIVYLASDQPENETNFENYLKSHPQAHTDNQLNRPKILLITIVEASMLFSFCDKYAIEGIIDYKYYQLKLTSLVEKVLHGERIREGGKVDVELAPIANLSKEEVCFANLLLEEKTKEQIVRLLKISERTYRRRLKNLFAKSKVSSLIGLHKLFVEKKCI